MTLLTGRQRWKGEDRSGKEVALDYNGVTQQIGISSLGIESSYFLAPGTNSQTQLSSSLLHHWLQAQVFVAMFWYVTIEMCIMEIFFSHSEVLFHSTMFSAQCGELLMLCMVCSVGITALLTLTCM